MNDRLGMIPGPEEMLRLQAWAEKFNEHLNECRQCRQNPLALCDKGESILKTMPRE